MSEQKQLYKCGECGNLVEVLVAGTCAPNCCDREMELLTAKTEEAGFEKHLPVIEEVSGGVKVKVGSVTHPMEENHYIAVIEIDDGRTSQKALLKPGQEPAAEFKTGAAATDITAREYCTVHGLWAGNAT